ncbi:MAG: amino acid transporter substrate-binding protein family [Bryobacterales bacterium]|nr:amino acid transporter substrate-binding protein family [Bryobacterales bacterium]
MRRTILAVLTFALGFGAGFIEIKPAYSQQSIDPRIADLVRTGKLRVAIGLGSPVLGIKNAQTGEIRGPALDLGRALAARMGVDFVAIEYPRPGAIMEGLKANAWDVTFLVADADRAAVADFSAPYFQSDFTYLVPAGSSIRNVADVDRPGIRIASPRGDASSLYLQRTIKHAELVDTATLDAAFELLRTGAAEARAAPRPTLLAESARLPGFRILDDGYAAISYVAMVPKGQPAHLAYISEFIEEA